MDQPTIDGLNTWILSNHAKKQNQSFLSELGLDESCYLDIKLENILKHFIF